MAASAGEMAVSSRDAGDDFSAASPAGISSLASSGWRASSIFATMVRNCDPSGAATFADISSKRWTVCCTVPGAAAHSGIPIHTRPVQNKGCISASFGCYGTPDRAADVYFGGDPLSPLCRLAENLTIAGCGCRRNGDEPGEDATTLARSYSWGTSRRL